MRSCSDASADFPQHSPNRKISSTDLMGSSNECVIKKFRGNELFPRRHVVSETAIAKEDILKTIEEAEKILTDNPCWDTSETSANQKTENYDQNNSSEKSTEEVKDDKKQERVNETVSQKEIAFIEDEDKINSVNTIIEKVAVSESDVVDSNLQKIAEITCPDRPKSRLEIRETLEKIAEEKRKIKDRKKESLETLSKKFEEIDKLVADHNYTFHVSDNDSCELKTPEDPDITVDSDSLDEFQVRIDPENFEVPLTKSEIVEKLRVEELEKELASEIEEQKKLMDEYREIIATDLDKIQLTLESESMQAYVDTDEEARNESKEDDEKINEEFSNETSEIANNTTVIKIDSEFDDFLEELKEPEKTYIKGKIYDFDEKKHGVR